MRSSNILFSIFNHTNSLKRSIHDRSFNLLYFKESSLRFSKTGRSFKEDRLLLSRYKEIKLSTSHNHNISLIWFLLSFNDSNQGKQLKSVSTDVKLLLLRSTETICERYSKGRRSHILGIWSRSNQERSSNHDQTWTLFTTSWEVSSVFNWELFPCWCSVSFWIRVSTPDCIRDQHQTRVSDKIEKSKRRESFIKKKDIKENKSQEEIGK